MISGGDRLRSGIVAWEYLGRFWPEPESQREICLETANAVVAVACPHPALGSRTRCRCDGAGGTPARAEHAGDSLSGRADRSDRVPCLSGKGFRREAAGDEGKGRTRRFPDRKSTTLNSSH